MASISAFDKLNPAPQLQPLDWGFLAKAKELQDNKQGKLIDLLGDASSKLPVQGGYATQKLAKQYNQTIDQTMQTFRDRIFKGENPMKVYGDLKSVAAKIQTDPIYQAIVADRAEKERVDKDLEDPLFAQAIQDYYNPNEGFGQISAEDIKAGWTPALHYKSIKPSNDFEQYSPIYKQIISSKTRQYDDINFEKFYDDKGNYVVRSTTTGKDVETITPDQVFEIGKRMAYNPDSGFMNLPNNQYRTAKMYREASGMTENNISPELAGAEAFRDNYVGYFRRELEIQPKVSQSIVKDGSGSGSGKKDADQITQPNPIINAFETADSQGSATVTDMHALSRIAGGHKPDEEGTFKLSLTGSPTIMQFGSNADPAQKQDLTRLNLYTRYKNALEEAFDANAKAQKKPTVAQQVAQGLVNPVNILMDKVAQGLKPNEVGDISKNEKLKAILEEGRQLGIELSDPNTKVEMETLSSTPELALANDLSIGLRNAKGTVNFRPNRENNLGTTDAGDFTVDGNAEVPASQLINILGPKDAKLGETRLEEAIKLGLVTLVNSRKTVGTNGGVALEPVYEVPISKIVDPDVVAITDDYFRYNSNNESAKEVGPQVQRAESWTQGFKQTKDLMNQVRPYFKDPRKHLELKGTLSNTVFNITDITAKAVFETALREADSRYESGDKATALKITAQLYAAINEQLKKEGKAPLKLK